MVKKLFNMAIIYQPEGKAAEYSEWACNFFYRTTQGCPNNCTYCFNKHLRDNHVSKGIKPDLKPSLQTIPNALSVFEKEVERKAKVLKKKGLFFSFTTDPCLPETIELTLLATEICQQHEVPVKILTKCDILKNDVHGALLEMPKKNLISIGFTLTGCDELEPNALLNLQRIEQLKIFKEYGFKTAASIEPIIDFKKSAEMIWRVRNFCDLIMVGMQSGRNYFYNDKVNAKNFVQWLTSLQKSKIYLKESLQELSGYTNSELDEYFVGSEYSLFPNGKNKIAPLH